MITLNSTRSRRVVALAGLAMLASQLGFVRPVRTNDTNRPVSADSVAGEWTARGADPSWNGRFVLHLVLQQIGDSVSGTYQFDLDGVPALPPADLAGRIRSGRLQLVDRADSFWLSAALRRDRLSGQLAGGTRKRSSAIPISFDRVNRR
jgi:hypothetical protein